MKLNLVISAYLEAIALLAGNARLRSLMLRPFLVGVIVYLVGISLGVYFFSDIRAIIDPELQSWFAYLVNPLIWLATLLIVLVGSLFLVVIITLSLLGILQTPIAEEVFSLKGVTIQKEPTSIRRVTFLVIWELIKLILVLTLVIGALLIGLFPLFLPVSFIISAWIVGFESFDVALDAAGKPIRQRLKLTLRNPLLVTISGAGGVALALIPFVAIILPSLAVTSAAIMIAKDKALYLN